MNPKRWFFATACVLLAAYVVAQTQTSSSQTSSHSQTGNATSSASSSSSARAGGNHSASSSSNGSHNGSGGGSGSGSGISFSGKPTHAILYTLANSSSAQARQTAFDNHMNYLGDQQQKGKVLLYGPWRDLPGSMAIVVATSDDDATAIAQNDPAVRSGALTFEVRAWNVVTPSSNGRGGQSSSSNQGNGSQNGGSQTVSGGSRGGGA